MSKASDNKSRADHEAVRNNVGYYDFTHQLMEVEGKDAPEFLDTIYVAPIDKAKVGQAKYTTMLDEDGKIIDDVIVFRDAEDDFRISTLFIDQLEDWINKHKADFDIEYENITDSNTMYAIQGPNSRELLNDLLVEPIDDLGHFYMMPNKVDDIDVVVVRSGYTGELGYELYVDSDKANELEEKLVEVGKDYDLKNITTNVIIESLPREKGYVLMSDLEGLTPIEADFSWSIGWDKNFIGKDKLSRGEKPEKELLGFTVDDETAEVEPGDEVFLGEEKVGNVTVYTYGYTVGKNIGFVVLDTTKAKIGDEVVIGEEKIPAVITERIFYDKDNKRLNA